MQMQLIYYRDLLQIHTHAYIHTYMHTYIHTHTFDRDVINLLSGSLADTYMHTTHAHTHTYTHTHIRSPHMAS
jgi:hypothetical protein